jgi:hypothetical protein
MSGDYFLGAVLAAALTKLDLRSRAMPSSTHSNQDTAACMLIISGIMKLGREPHAAHPIDGDSGMLPTHRQIKRLPENNGVANLNSCT